MTKVYVLNQNEKTEARKTDDFIVFMEHFHNFGFYCIAGSVLTTLASVGIGVLYSGMLKVDWIL